MKAVVAAFNQEKALVGAFSVITNLRMQLFESLVSKPDQSQRGVWSRDPVLPSDWLLQVRASTPMFLLARRVKATGVKMVLSGEGSDEVFGGYLYFHKVGPVNRFILLTS